MDIKYHEHFEIFRGYVRNEDNLVHNRTSWNTTIQGFLFATYGWSLPKIIPVANTHFVPGVTENSSLALILLLPLLGGLISLVSLAGIRAAQLAINSLNLEWKEIQKQTYDEDSLRLPMLIGGGCPKNDPSVSEKAHRLGKYAPNYIAYTFIVVWMILLLVSSASAYYYYSYLRQ